MDSFHSGFVWVRLAILSVINQACLIKVFFLPKCKNEPITTCEGDSGLLTRDFFLRNVIVVFTESVMYVFKKIRNVHGY